jgi:hypothetical protein
LTAFVDNSTAGTAIITNDGDGLCGNEHGGERHHHQQWHPDLFSR